MAMMLWMFVFWGLVIASGVWLLLSWRGGTDDRDALEVLRSRLARGEIDVQEFEQREVALGRSQGRTLRQPVIAAAAAIVLLVAIPVVIIAANDWDMGMWDTHGQGRNTAGDPVVRRGSATTVRIEDFAFDPGNLEVPLGATVTWTNGDSAPHDATSRGGEWKTTRLSDGESDTLTFTSAGTYDYYCSIHSGMKARLVVR